MIPAFRLTYKLPVFGILAVTSAACANAAGPPVPKPIMEMTAASVEVLQPNTIRICALGKVRTGGWTQPTLQPRVYVVPPKDGIWEVDFLATPPAPGTIVIQQVLPIRAKKVWPNYPAKELKGVKVNGVVAMLGAKPNVCPAG